MKMKADVKSSSSLTRGVLSPQARHLGSILVQLILTQFGPHLRITRSVTTKCQGAIAKVRSVVGPNVNNYQRQG